MYLGEVIKAYRRKHHLSMQAFADLAGLSKPYISQLERNRNPKTGDSIIPSPDTFQKVANAMGISFNELISKVDEDQPLVIAELKNNLSQELLDASRTPASMPSNILLPAARSIPILGTFEEGTREIRSKNLNGGMLVDSSMKADYCLKVWDEGMSAASIAKDDYAFITKDYKLTGGKIYAVVPEHGGKPLLRKMNSECQELLPEADSVGFESIPVSDESCWIIGELVGIYHRFK